MRCRQKKISDLEEVSVSLTTVFMSVDSEN